LLATRFFFPMMMMAFAADRAVLLLDSNRFRRPEPSSSNSFRDDPQQHDASGPYC
jgi:hypothetical protein